MVKRPAEIAHPSELITAAIGSALALLMAFGISISDTQAAAILQFVSLLPALITMMIAGSRAWRREAGAIDFLTLLILLGAGLFVFGLVAGHPEAVLAGVIVGLVGLVILLVNR